MFRIRRIFDDFLPVDAAAMARAEDILQERFPDAPEGEFAALGEKLRSAQHFFTRLRDGLYLRPDELFHKAAPLPHGSATEKK